MSDSHKRLNNSSMFPSTPLPPQPHINPMFSSAKVHINPNFTPSNAPSHPTPLYSATLLGSTPNASCKHSSKVLVNPKFKISPPSSPHRPPVPPPHTMHINPKFTNRPLPSVPPPAKPVRASLVRNSSLSSTSLPENSQPQENIYAKVGELPVVIDRKKKEKFEDSIKKSLENKKVLINPNFVVPPKTVHPSKPARNSLLITTEMSQRLEQELEKTRRKDKELRETPKVSVDKENVPSVKSKLNLFTPLRKSAFKKIGSRKLVRVKRKSGGSPGTPNASFKKIGSKKLIRIHESAAGESDKASIYHVKTKTKIVKTVKNTPTNTSKYRFSFITPLSLRRPKVTARNSGSLKKSSGKKRLSSFRSRFKLDRRSKQTKAEPKVLFQSSKQPRLKKLSGMTYKVSATKLSKVSTNPPCKPHRTKHLVQPHPTLANSKVITVQGVKFSVADNGRKLKRLPSSLPSPSLSYSASVSQSCPTSTSPGQVSSSPQADNKTSPVTVNTSSTTTSKKVYLGGEEFDEIEPGVFSRSRHSLTRQSITLAKNRSINTIMKNANRSKQYCMFYNKFGKCTKKESGSCPFLHDQDKVAVCRRFLQGSCVKEKCLLSHKVAPEKMPACKYFLSGVCSKEDCPYLHVKVSAKAEICQAFLKGYCSNGSDCKQRHVMACPEFDRTGSCVRVAGKCPFPHVSRTPRGDRTPDTEKRIPPAKPKRKSLGQTPDHSTKKSRVQARYYEDRQGGQVGEGEKKVVVETDEMEAKRQRLLRKIELAKKGWSGVTVSVPAEVTTGKLDDSGPYEKIDSDSSDGEGEEQGRAVREPIGQLGDFISLAGYSSEEEEKCTDRRLI
eukprot:GFUD01032015.1.p1 GENE.GFUD01032015.1~~GFUD01032015.1.p1  ORF type:complete len:839 (-),score=276.56 GFUD01032015.1:49-2565(-)